MSFVRNINIQLIDGDSLVYTTKTNYITIYLVRAFITKQTGNKYFNLLNDNGEKITSISSDITDIICIFYPPVCEQCGNAKDSYKYISFHDGLCFDCYRKKITTSATFDVEHTTREINTTSLTYKLYFINKFFDGIEVLDKNGVVVNPKTDDDVLLIDKNGGLVLQSALPSDFPIDFLNDFMVVEEDTHILKSFNIFAY